MKKDSLEELAAFCKSPGYGEFVRKLIVQGMIKIQEDVVEIHSRAEDRAVVTKVVSTDFTHRRTLLCLIVKVVLTTHLCGMLCTFH